MSFLAEDSPPKALIVGRDFDPRSLADGRFAGIKVIVSDAVAPGACYLVTEQSPPAPKVIQPRMLGHLPLRRDLFISTTQV